MRFRLDLKEDFNLRIGAHIWLVKLVDHIEDDGDNDAHLWGVCDAATQTIEIRKSAPYSMRLSTFLHELIHAMESVYEISPSHQDLNIIGDVFSQILLDNFAEKKK